MLQTRCFAWYTLRKHIRRRGDESDGGKSDDRCLHFSALLGIESPRSGLKLAPFHEWPHHAAVKAQHFDAVKGCMGWREMTRLFSAAHELARRHRVGIGYRPLSH